MKVNRNRIVMIVLVSLLLMSGCAGSKIKTLPPVPTLESSHKVRKDVEYCIEKRCFTLKKGGIYINNQDAAELLHYIDKLK